MISVLAVLASTVAFYASGFAGARLVIVISARTRGLVRDLLMTPLLAAYPFAVTGATYGAYCFVTSLL